MSIKEKPLIDAVEKLGPLPGWLFSHPALAGFFAIVMCPIFGAVFVFFWALIGNPDPVTLFNAMRTGGIVTTFLGAFVIVLITISGFREPDETANRLLFAAGGASALALLIAVDWFFKDDVRAWLVTREKIFCPLGMC